MKEFALFQNFGKTSKKSIFQKNLRKIRFFCIKLTYNFKKEKDFPVFQYLIFFATVVFLGSKIGFQNALVVFSGNILLQNLHVTRMPKYAIGRGSFRHSKKIFSKSTGLISSIKVPTNSFSLWEKYSLKNSSFLFILADSWYTEKPLLYWLLATIKVFALNFA